jgi:heat shock protein HslJ
MMSKIIPVVLLVSLLIGCSSINDSSPAKNKETQTQLQETKNKGEHFKGDTLEKQLI